MTRWVKAVEPPNECAVAEEDETPLAAPNPLDDAGMPLTLPQAPAVCAAAKPRIPPRAVVDQKRLDRLLREETAAHAKRAAAFAAVGQRL